MKDNKLSIKEILSNIKFMAGYLFRVNKKLYFVRVPMLLLQVASSLIGIFFLGKLLDIITISREFRQAIYCVLLWSVAQGGMSILLNGLVMYDNKEAERTRINLRLELAKAAAAMPLSEVEQPYMKDLIYLAQSDSSIEDFIRNFNSLVRAVLQVITFSFLIAAVQPWILLVVLVNVIWRLWLQHFRLAFDEKWRVDKATEFRKSDHLNGLLYNAKYGKEVRVNHLVEWILKKAVRHYKSDIHPRVKECVQDHCTISLLAGAVNVVNNLVIYLILSYQVIFQAIRIGDFSINLTSTEKLMEALNFIMYAYSNLMEEALFVKEFRYCLEFVRKEKARQERKRNLGQVQPSIEFKDVSFQYPNTGRKVLSHISFVIHPGETVALVGLNGSGKSTMVKLLCRFYEPTGGEILVGGINIREIAMEDYISIIGVVFQDYKLFSFTVAENVTMGMDKGNGSCRACIEKSGLHDKLQGLQDHEDTYVTKRFDEGGIEFSGGESQKLAIARTIYKDAPIVVVDEPTAAMDPVMEYEIFRRFGQIVTGKTAIYISHRLSATRIADKIMVLQNGRICEAGSHEQLMAMETGIYKEMFSRQAVYYQK